MVQKTVNIAQALGVPGEFYDDSPRRVAPYILKSGEGQIPAEGTVSFSANPADGDSLTLGETTYTFKETLAAANDIKLGASLNDTIATLVRVVNGSGAAGTDYFAGTTTPNASVSAMASGNVVDLIAKQGGIAGNSIALGSSGSAITLSGANMSGGSAGAVLPTVARVFTAGTEDNEAVIGGTGAFRGILVEPKQYANYMNFAPTMTVPEGIIGELATMGHILIEAAGEIKPDMVAVYNNATGAISGVEAGAEAPSGSTLIPNSKFILRSAAAGEVAILELTD